MHPAIEKNFSFYANRTVNEYFILDGDGRQIETNSLLVAPKDKIKVEVNGDKCRFTITNKFVKELSPDTIDSCEFWKEATDRFPLFSIAGGVQNFQTIAEVNNATLQMAAMLGVLGPLVELYKRNSKLKVLEIGPGHGGLMERLKAEELDDNYFAIDVNPLFNHPRIFKTNGKTIPDTIPDLLDVVYSMNVFQHLSKKQRTAYYKQIYKLLKFDGIFLFGMFVVTEENKNWDSWGYRDKEGRYYVSFFRQLTEADHIDTINKELYEIGFSSVEQLNVYTDRTNYLTFKVTK